MITVTKRKIAKVKRVVKEENKSKLKYVTTYKDIKKYFNFFNDNIFDGELEPFNDIQIKELKYQKCVGQVIITDWKRKGTKVYELEMNQKYDTKKDFLDTLVHEMVHLYQMTILKDTGNHNKTFYSFRPVVGSMGLEL